MQSSGQLVVDQISVHILPSFSTPSIPCLSYVLSTPSIPCLSYVPISQVTFSHFDHSIQKGIPLTIPTPPEMLCLRSLAQALPPMAQIPRASLATSAFLNFSKVGQAKKVPSQCCLQGQQVSAAEKSGDQGRSGSKVGSIWRLPQYSGLGHVS